MVNLIAGREVVPELIQSRMTGQNIAAQTMRLLADETARNEMKAGLADVSSRLSGSPGGSGPDPRRLWSAGAESAQRRAAELIERTLEGQIAHVS